MSKKNRVEFIIYKDGSNKTVLLKGHLDSPSLQSIHANNKSSVISDSPSHNGNFSMASDPYDSTGAMTYVVAVIVVYGISMFFIVATLIRRKSHNKSLDIQVSTYVKGLQMAREQAKLECVLRTRLKWPGNFIQFGTREWDNNDDDSDTDSQNSYSMDNFEAAKHETRNLLANKVSEETFGGDEHEGLGISSLQSSKRRQRYVRKELLEENDDSSYDELPAVTYNMKFIDEEVEDGDDEMINNDGVFNGVQIIK